MIFPNRSPGYRGPDRRSPLATAVDGGYRGPDRRSQARTPGRRLSRRILLAITVLAVVLVAVGSTTPQRALGTFVLLRALGDALLLLAGAARLLNWRVTGRAAPALTGAAFVIVGGLMLPLQALGFLLHANPMLRYVAPSCTVVLGLCGAYLCIRATRLGSVVATLRPLREASVLAGGALGALVMFGVIRTVAGPVDHVLPWACELGVVALAWLVAASGYVRRSVPAGLEPRLALAIAGLGLADALLAFSLDDHLTVAASAAAVQTVAGAGAFLISAGALEHHLGQQGSRTLRLAGELGDTVQVLAQEQAARHQMLHDARSTLAAIRLANGTLSRYQEQLDAMLQDELRDAVSTELVRLEEMLTHDHGRDRTTFRLDETLVPVVRIFRDSGLDVRVDLEGAPQVFGRPVDTATVIHALLTNAACYGGGCPVEVTVRRASAAVQVLVADRGPGVGPDEKEDIFRRGHRGRAAAGRDGSGLGLFIGRWLMDEQEGSLQVEDRPGGGARFVVTLPTAASRRASQSARASGEAKRLSRVGGAA